MSRIFSSIKIPFDDSRSRELNPVLLKELRQAMRNPFLTGALMFLLASLFLVWLAILGRQNFVVDEQSQTGVQVIKAFLTILTTVSLFCIPLYTGSRFAIERMTPAGELMFATSLPVWRIIRGKFLSAAYIQILFFSIFLPFMAVAGLLRGVDLPTILLILFCLFIVVCVAVQAAVAAACIPMPLFGRLGIGVFFTVALGGSGWGAMALFFSMLRFGIGTLVVSFGFWFLFGLFLVAATIAYVVLYGFSVTMLFDERRLRRHCRTLMRKGVPAPSEQPQTSIDADLQLS